MLDSHFEHFSNTALRVSRIRFRRFQGPSKAGTAPRLPDGTFVQKACAKSPAFDQNPFARKIWPRKSLKTTGLDRAKGCAPQFKI